MQDLKDILTRIQSDNVTIGSATLEAQKIFAQELFEQKNGLINLINLGTNLRTMLLETTKSTIMANNPKYSDPRSLTKHEHRLFSQNGEDGIINEIFNRIGTTNKYVVEFGGGEGLENNSSLLILNGWQGLWMEANEKHFNTLRKNFSKYIDEGKLQVKNSFIYAENIESLFKEANVPTEPDLLSVDIDGNDYWVWKAIENYSPRVVIIEYNASLGPCLNWTIKYNPEHVWNDRSIYYGASLKTLELLGKEKGYKLVGCTFSGVNAFFVREDLVKDKFLEPYTSENHYEPVRYIYNETYGYKKKIGEFIPHVN